MSKTDKNLAVANTGSSVFESLQKVNDQLKQLSSITDRKYKTSQRMEGFPKKVEEETDIQQLVKMLSSVRARKVSYDAVHEELSDILPNAPVFKIEGSTYDDWKEDIRLRIQFLSQKERVDKLTKIKTSLKDLMDKEDKLALLNKELADFAGEKSDESTGDISDAEVVG